MSETKLKLILEALLMSASHPLTIEKMLETFEEWQQPTITDVKATLAELANDYQERAIALKELANGYCFQTRMEYHPWVSKLLMDKPTKYSRALLETLAIIAYKQPVTRGDIEDIRGVAVSSQILRTLIEREWIRVIGHRDVPGKPAVYGTTKHFLDYFNLKHLDDLPRLTLNE